MKYNRIRDVLQIKDKSQAWLAREMGISRNSINKLCSNSAQPSLKRLFEIAEILDVSPCELLNIKK